jgi:hypothetical protein
VTKNLVKSYSCYKIKLKLDIILEILSIGIEVQVLRVLMKKFYIIFSKASVFPCLTLGIKKGVL